MSREPERQTDTTSLQRGADMPALTSIRALFAWWVVVYHFAPLAPFSANQATPLIGKGVTMVDCFFVLSGIVLMHAHPALMLRPAWADVRDFLVARLARIYPLHATMLLLFCVLVGGLWLASGIWPNGTIQFAGRALLAHVLLLHGWGFTDGMAWNYPSWSVSSEWAAYLAAPAMFFAIHRFRPAMLLVLAAALAVLIVVAVEDGGLLSPAAMVPRVLLEFLLGSSLSAYRPYAVAVLGRVRGPALLFGWASAAVLAPTDHPGLFLGAVVWVMVLLGLRTERASGLAGRLERISIYLGETSYAVYLCHALVATIWAGLSSRLALGPLANPVCVAIAVALSVQAMATILHHSVEDPARRTIRSWNARLRSAASLPPLASAVPQSLTLDTGTLADPT